VVKELRSARFRHPRKKTASYRGLLAPNAGGKLPTRFCHEEFSEGDDPSSWYDLTEQALTKAIKLYSLGRRAAIFLLLPYTFPIPVLAAFFYLHPDPSTLGVCGY